MTARVAVVGGGVAGLATAWYLRAADSPPDVTIIESSSQLGGKLRTTAVGGVRVELGADSFLTVPDHAVRLCHRLGLGDEMVAPAAQQVQVWTRGKLYPLPEGSMLGVPTRLRPLLTSGLLTRIGAARAALDLVLPRSLATEDASVGRWIGSRLGREIVERLVDPVLGGVYAGDVDRLSVVAATPRLAEAARLHRSLLLGLRARDSNGEQEAGPLSRTLRGGLCRLVDRLLVDPRGRGQVEPRGRGLEVRRPATARRVLPHAGGYRVELVDADPIEADSVVLAVPAFAAAALLRDAAPVAAGVLAKIPYASVAVVTFIYPPGTHTPAGSGMLVPSGEGRFVKAATWVSSK
ncbi:MAG: protoporphyrinogen oxidase, partial [Actinomycetota bacterium]|nr:protoporphyrinogen oxidase [Actinomycetota bacterium]